LHDYLLSVTIENHHGKHDTQIVVFSQVSVVRVDGTKEDPRWQGQYVHRSGLVQGHAAAVVVVDVIDALSERATSQVANQSTMHEPITINANAVTVQGRTAFGEIRSASIIRAN